MADPIIRESTKHGRLLDEDMAEEASRPNAGEDATGLPADGDDALPGEPAPPVAGARPDAPDDPSEGTAEREVREEIRRLVADATYPADRNDLLRHIGPDGRSAVHAHLRALPPDIVFAGPDEVASAFGGIRSAE